MPSTNEAEGNADIASSYSIDSQERHHTITTNTTNLSPTVIVGKNDEDVIELLPSPQLMGGVCCDRGSTSSSPPLMTKTSSSSVESEMIMMPKDEEDGFQKTASPILLTRKPSNKMFLSVPEMQERKGATLDDDDQVCTSSPGGNNVSRNSSSNLRKSRLPSVTISGEEPPAPRCSTPSIPGAYRMSSSAKSSADVLSGSETSTSSKTRRVALEVLREKGGSTGDVVSSCRSMDDDAGGARVRGSTPPPRIPHRSSGSWRKRKDGGNEDSDMSETAIKARAFRQVRNEALLFLPERDTATLTPPGSRPTSLSKTTTTDATSPSSSPSLGPGAHPFRTSSDTPPRSTRRAALTPEEKKKKKAMALSTRPQVEEVRERTIDDDGNYIDNTASNHRFRDSRRTSSSSSYDPTEIKARARRLREDSRSRSRSRSRSNSCQRNVTRKEDGEEKGDDSLLDATDEPTPRNGRVSYLFSESDASGVNLTSVENDISQKKKEKERKIVNERKISDSTIAMKTHAQRLRQSSRETNSSSRSGYEGPQVSTDTRTNDNHSNCSPKSSSAPSSHAYFDDGTIDSSKTNSTSQQHYHHHHHHHLPDVEGSSTAGDSSKLTTLTDDNPFSIHSNNSENLAVARAVSPSSTFAMDDFYDEEGNRDADGQIIPSATEYDPDAKPSMSDDTQKFRKRCVIAVVVLILAAVGIALVVVFVVVKDDGTDGGQSLFYPSMAPSVTPSMSPTAPREVAIKTKIMEGLGVVDQSYLDTDQARSLAFDWIANNDQRHLVSNDAELLPRFVLATLFYATGGLKDWKDCSFMSLKDTAQSNAQGLSAVDDSADYIISDGELQTGDAQTRKGNQQYLCSHFVESRNKNDTGLMWLSPAHHCDWFGVGCDGDDSMIPVSIEIDENNLKGTIPTELQVLHSKLQFLSLNFNLISGTLPKQLGTLTNLRHLQFHTNSMDGTIPPQIYSLTHLQSLNFGSNALTGHLPTALGNFTSLKALYLDKNQLTGTIPTQIGNLRDLLFLRLNENVLEGSMPTQLGNLAKLKELHLMTNLLTGQIPETLSSMTDLETLFLQSNKLNGSFPDAIYSMVTLDSLYLFDNQMYGSISDDVANLKLLEKFILRRNNFSGSIPNALIQKPYNQSKLSRLWLHFNDFVGTASDDFCKLYDYNVFYEFYTDCLPTRGIGEPPVICNCCTKCCDTELETCRSVET